MRRRRDGGGSGVGVGVACGGGEGSSSFAGISDRRRPLASFQELERENGGFGRIGIGALAFVSNLIWVCLVDAACG